MIQVKTNLKDLVANLKPKLQKLRDKEYLLRPVAFNVISLMTERIHIKGLASDGAEIGQYSPGYMIVRTGAFKNATETKTGKRKDAGTFKERPDNMGKKGQRPQYHRSEDTKVIISLTRQLENDYAVVGTEKGYAIGFNNKHNFDKAGWVEKTYKKKIFKLTQSESEYAVKKLSQLVRDALKK